MSNLYPVLRGEAERLIRHALVPIVILYFADRLGQEGAAIVGEGMAIIVSYLVVLAWSKINESRAAKAPAEPAEGEGEA